MRLLSPAQRVVLWVLLLAALGLAALIANDQAAAVRDRGCPWETDCATPASIEGSEP
jgi:hypothetical protein